MKTKLLLLITIILMGFSFETKAQTLVAGDIVVIGMGSNTGPAAPGTLDEFSWVPLVNLDANTIIYFTDAGWNTASNEFMGSGNSFEILLKYTVPTGGVLAGVVKTVSEGSNLPALGYTVIQSTKCGNDTALTIANVGDQVTVFTSTATPDANFPAVDTFTPIFSLTNETTSWTALTATTAAVTPASSKQNYTNLVKGLTNGENALAIGLGPAVRQESDDVRYVGSTTGSKAVILAAVTTASNWRKYDGSPTISVGADFLANNGTSPVLGWTANGVSNFSVSGADITVPSVSSIALVGSPATNSSSVTFTVTFSEAVTNVSTDDFTVATVSGTATGSVTGVSGSGTTYTITVSSIAGTGSLKLNLKSNTNIIDTSNNGNGTNGFVAAYTSGGTQNVDLDNPTVSMTSPQSDPTNATGITVNITFNESVTGFTNGDIGVVNGTAGSFSGSGASYSALITPSGDGTVTVSIAAGVAIDAANNSNNTVTSLTRVSDRTQPTVTMTSTATNPTNAGSFTLSINFSESVNNFVVGDINISNATLSSFSGSGSAYSVTVTPTSDGTVTADIAAGVANDAAGNTNTVASQFSRVSDKTQPTVSVSSVTANPTNSNSIPVTITFSESVVNFIASDITVGNGSISSFAGSGSNYSFNLIPSSNGTVTVNIAANVANDSAGNGNTAATQFSRVYDSVNPTVTMSSVTTSPTNSTSIPVTVTFSEVVTGFTSGDVSVGNATLSGFSGSGSSYSFNLIPSGSGTVTANIVAGIAIDNAGNGNTSATQFSITYDNSQPSISITSVTSSPTNLNSIPVTFTFSESVTGFIAGDVTVGNGSLSDFSGSGSSYSANIIPSSSGTVTVNVSAAAVIDAAGNNNTAATQFSITYDNSQPTVSITSATSNPTNTNSIPVTITFSEAVINFIASDITVGNGSVSGFTGSGSNYSFNLIPSANGTVTVDIAGNMANDAAGNGNTAATQFSRVYDSVNPTLNITSTSPNPTNANTIPVTFTFSEAVTGFASDDITITNGTISNFSGSGSTYSATVTPSGDGTISLFVFQGNAVDNAGNSNTFASFSIVSDRTKPTVTISSPEVSPTSANPIPINFNFSEAVNNFVVGDITVTGGTLSGFSGSGSSYSVNLVLSASGSKTIKLLAGVLNDSAGNTNNLSSTFSIGYLAACSVASTWNGFFWVNGDPTPNQPAIITADYSTNGVDLSACSLIIGNNAQVIINSGDDVTISNNVTVQVGSTLAFESGSNLIQSGTTNNNSGSITYLRPTSMRRLDYTYWSSPVAGQNLKLFSPQTVSPPVGASRFYVLNELTNVFDALDPLTTNFSAAKGYSVRAPNNFPDTSTTFEGVFTGVPNNGTYTIPVTVTPAGSNGYNLIGNPYPSTVDANLFLTTNPGTLYFWTHNVLGPTSGANYASYNLTGGTASILGGDAPNGTIQTGQGFLIQKNTAGTVTFNNTMRVGNNDNQFYKTAQSDRSRLWLNLSQGSTFLNQILVGYMQNATTGVDESLDGKLLENGSTISSKIDSDNYIIQARPLPFENTDIVPLSFKALTAGTYTLSVDHSDGLFSVSQDVFIKDNLIGTVQNIKQNPYSFASTEGTFTSRFEIIYQSSPLGIGNSPINANNVIVYKKDNLLSINSGIANMKSVKLFDISGRLIFEKSNINSNQATITNLKTEQQVLLVQITFDDNKIITKKIVY